MCFREPKGDKQAVRRLETADDAEAYLVAMIP